MIGANTILISLMKTSPSGFRSVPMFGAKTPQNDAGSHADQNLNVEFSEKAANHDVSPSSSEAIGGLTALVGLF
jgi:hypothetical protein